MPVSDTSKSVGGGGSSISNLVAVRVVDIILDDSHPDFLAKGGWDSLGSIFYIGATDVKSPSEEAATSTEHVAKPLFPNIKQYPLKNEIVLLVTTTSKGIYNTTKPIERYYLPPINIWSHQHHNALPRADQLTENETAQDYKQTESGILRQVEDGDSEIDLGKYFKEQLNVKPLLPYEGDYIIEGRYGNSIRFGASVKDDVLPENNKNDWSQGDEEIGTPITIIRNGQSGDLDDKGWIPTIEDINRDDSSIYMTSNQKISSLIIASTNFQSYKAKLEPPSDPLTELINPPIAEVKAPESPDSEEETQPDFEEASVEQDLEITPDEISADDVVKDSLSPYDALLASGEFDDSDFQQEFEEVTESQTISPSDSPALEPNNEANDLSGDVDINQNIGKYFRLEHLIASDTAKRKNINNLPGADGRIKSSTVINNLTLLMENVGDKIYEKYPKMVISSGFRCYALNRAIKGSTTSEHSYGKAIDLQVPGTNTSVVFNWIKNNIPTWNQMIWEFPEAESSPPGRGSWIHISYGGANNKKKTLASKKSSIHESYGGNRRGSYQDGIEIANQNIV